MLMKKLPRQRKNKFFGTEDSDSGNEASLPDL